MKKFLVFIMMLIPCCSYSPEKSEQQKEMERYETASTVFQQNADLFELTFKDEYGEERTHQFVSIQSGNHMSGIAHWPDCKYCKERGLQKHKEDKKMKKFNTLKI